MKVKVRGTLQTLSGAGLHSGSLAGSDGLGQESTRWLKADWRPRSGPWRPPLLGVWRPPLPGVPVPSLNAGPRQHSCQDGHWLSPPTPSFTRPRLTEGLGPSQAQTTEILRRWKFFYHRRAASENSVLEAPLCHSAARPTGDRVDTALEAHSVGETWTRCHYHWLDDHVENH